MSVSSSGGAVGVSSLTQLQAIVRNLHGINSPEWLSIGGAQRKWFETEQDSYEIGQDIDDRIHRVIGSFLTLTQLIRGQSIQEPPTLLRKKGCAAALITHFAELQLHTVSIQGVKQFYQQKLGFPVILETDNEIRFRPTPHFTLSFVEVSQPLSPAHFAFEVPYSTFSEGADFIRDREFLSCNGRTAEKLTSSRPGITCTFGMVTVTYSSLSRILT